MKVFYFLLIPLFIFAQNPDYPDTLFLKSGKNYPCLVNGINSKVVQLIYRNNQQSSTALTMVDKIDIGPMSSVYTAETGFSTSLDSVQSFVSNRNGTMQIESKNMVTLKPQSKNENQWSFGIFYVPSYSSIRYERVYLSPSMNPQLFALTYNESLVESNFSYLLSPKVQLTFDINYNSTYVKSRYEYHYIDNSYGYSNDEGYEIVQDMKTFEIHVGFKYYLAEFLTKKVCAFIQAGIGKQFAFINDKDKDLFDTSPSQTVIEDDENEYLEDINSPFLFHLGFGTEYFFNESLSLYAAIRFYYSKVSGTYNYRERYNDTTETRESEYEKSELLNRIGLGLNFYF